MSLAQKASWIQIIIHNENCGDIHIHFLVMQAYLWQQSQYIF